MNQVELHPYLQQDELREFHAAHGIVTEAWSPLASGGSASLETRDRARSPTSTASTPAQVDPALAPQLGNVVIPKSVTPSRIAENIDIFDFELDSDDLAAIVPLDRSERTGPDPDEFN